MRASRLHPWLNVTSPRWLRQHTSARPVRCALTPRASLSAQLVAASGRALATLMCILSLNAGLARSETPLERLAGAVRFPTVSYQDTARIDYEAFAGLNQYLLASYPNVFTELEFERVNQYSLLLRWPGSAPNLEPVLFTAHTDVVPVEPGTEANWTHPPFAGVIDDGVLYGRGTLDDKHGVISLLEAINSLLTAGYRPARSLVFAFGHDEEIGGEAGAGAMAKKMAAQGLRFAWMVDEGGFVLRNSPLLPDRDIAFINVAEKGYVTLTLAAESDGGHSSSPGPESAIAILGRAVVRLQENPFPPKLVEPVRSFLETLAPELEQPQRFLFEHLWVFDGLVARQMADNTLTQPLVRTTTALTVFQAGVKENVIPQRAAAKVNFRLLPGDTEADLIREVTEIIDDPRITISNDRWADRPGIAAADGPGYQMLAKAIGATYRDAVIVPGLLQATTDTRHYVSLARDQYRFHGNIIEPQQTSSIHGTNEFISAESFTNMVAVTKQLLRDAGNAP